MIQHVPGVRYYSNQYGDHISINSRTVPNSINVYPHILGPTFIYSIFMALLVPQKRRADGSINNNKDYFAGAYKQHRKFRFF